MDEPVCRKPLSWDLHVDHSTGEWDMGERGEGGGGQSFLQQLMARQTGPVSQNTHSTLQIAPKLKGTGELRRGHGRQRTVTAVDLPTNVFFVFFFSF